ncbi:hypothetical protein LZF95_20800 [Algoriphagus sp. AGSA1]|nr:hypothetical protein [Algoriphagus sp. AGSA1]MCE7057132.1 hypothetical protein [Algoriphagus sp. AGSA1]
MTTAGSQSHHTGIEIVDHLIDMLKWVSLNRTIQEIKLGDVRQTGGA